uniref:guanylate cyclase n=2 Tax=Hemiselmis andersenii TaxID=464988 RepID=A0A6U4U0M3_HEMAN
MLSQGERRGSIHSQGEGRSSLNSLGERMGPTSMVNTDQDGNAMNIETQVTLGQAAGVGGGDGPASESPPKNVSAGPAPPAMKIHKFSENAQMSPSLMGISSNQGNRSGAGSGVASKGMNLGAVQGSRSNQSGSALFRSVPLFYDSMMTCMFGKGYLDRQKLRFLKDEFVQEMRIVSKLRHPSVTTVMGAVLGSEPMLVMEFMTLGSLHDLLSNESYPFEADVLLFMLRDIVQGMRFLHTADPPIVHGDLKAANVLITENFKAKVADFGLSQKKRLGNVGTPFWMAPELLLGGVSTTMSDVYAFAIMLFEIFSRKLPYKGEECEQVLLQVCDSNLEKRPGIPDGVRPEVEVMMKDCWQQDASKRPPFEELDRRVKAMDVIQMQSSQILSAGAIDREQEATARNVLFDVFPRHIAEALASGRKPQAEMKECVTIFFSDIVGFTDISATLTPTKVSEMLDRLYTRFDALAEEHTIYKVETIGDAYMAVTNLVQDQNVDHAARIARFSLAALQAANQVLVDLDDPSKGHIKIRVGFHSGPVVANVVGTKCPRYCLFGDTVNTASRMESNSKANMINISHATAVLLKTQGPNILLQKRGQVPIKGKGHMTCYWVKTERKNTELKPMAGPVQHLKARPPIPGDPKNVSTIEEESLNNVSMTRSASGVTNTIGQLELDNAAASTYKQGADQASPPSVDKPSRTGSGAEGPIEPGDTFTVSAEALKKGQAGVAPFLPLNRAVSGEVLQAAHLASMDGIGLDGTVPLSFPYNPPSGTGRGEGGAGIPPAAGGAPPQSAAGADPSVVV